jgi:hypothetical protein
VGAFDHHRARESAARHVCAAGGDGLMLVDRTPEGWIRQGTIIKTPGTTPPPG